MKYKDPSGHISIGALVGVAVAASVAATATAAAKAATSVTQSKTTTPAPASKDPVVSKYADTPKDPVVSKPAETSKDSFIPDKEPVADSKAPETGNVQEKSTTVSADGKSGIDKLGYVEGAGFGGFGAGDNTSDARTREKDGVTYFNVRDMFPANCIDWNQRTNIVTISYAYGARMFVIKYDLDDAKNWLGFGRRDAVIAATVTAPDGTVGHVNVLYNNRTTYIDYSALQQFVSRFRGGGGGTAGGGGGRSNLPEPVITQAWINDWLVGHLLPSGTANRVVQRPDDWYSFLRAQNNHGFYPDWYNFERSNFLNTNVNSAAQYILAPGGARVNSDGRYWVAVGPGVTGAYTQGSVISLTNMYGDDLMGRNIDVLIERINVMNPDRYYIYCVIGDTKEHTGAGTIRYNNGDVLQVDGQGIYQTGISVITGLSAGANYADGSLIEFMGSSINGGLSEFRIVEILVY